jgi:hypothetical protein
MAPKRYTIEPKQFQFLKDELDRIEADFPGLLPSMNPDNLLHDNPLADEFDVGQDYDIQALRLYLAAVLARIEVTIEKTTASPVTESREFPFVHDHRIRVIIERDYGEIQRACIAGCWKSVIILSGGATEAILVDLLQADSRAPTASKAPKNPDVTRWDLNDLINVGVELKLVTPGVEKLSHAVREYRNLIHPGNEVRNKLTFNAEEARIAVEVVHMLHRSLSP